MPDVSSKVQLLQIQILWFYIVPLRSASLDPKLCFHRSSFQGNCFQDKYSTLQRDSHICTVPLCLLLYISKIHFSHKQLVFLSWKNTRNAHHWKLLRSPIVNIWPIIESKEVYHKFVDLISHLHNSWVIQLIRPLVFLQEVCVQTCHPTFACPYLRTILGYGLGKKMHIGIRQRLIFAFLNYASILILEILYPNKCRQLGNTPTPYLVGCQRNW